MSLVYVLFFLSGIAGLAYQVVWIREFGNVFGNTFESASLVTALFMLGLGVGSLLAGIWADKSYARSPSGPLRMYGAFELAIGGLGIVLASVLPHLGAVAAAASSYVTDARGWHVLSMGSYLARYGVAVILLMPITTLMGGTLTLLVRHLVRADLTIAGWRIGLLYGINTAGAALGAFLTDFTLIPVIGLSATQVLAAVCNLLAALGAFRLAKGLIESPKSEAPQPELSASASLASPSRRSSVPLVTIAIATAGFAGMGMEIVWFRHLVTTLGAFRSVLSLLLTTILVGIWLGSFVGGFLDRRTHRPAQMLAVAQAAFIVLAAGLLWVVPNHGPGFASGASTWSALGARLQPMLLLVAGPALLMGFTFPLANGLVQRIEGDVGRRAGALYLANTVGAVIGALVTGFVLLPRLGTQSSVAVVGLVTLLGLGALFFSARQTSETGPVLVVFGLAGAALLSVLVAWQSLPADFLITRAEIAGDYGLERTLDVSEGITETIAVVEADEGRSLFTNGHSMSANDLGAQRYMRAFVHVPFLMSDAPRRALVICFGVGNTAHSATLHPSLERLEVVDLSRNVLEHAHYFAATNHNVLENEKVEVFVNDGRHHLRMQLGDSYDLITLEPPPIAFAGMASLYSVEFYELAKSRLRPGGHLTQWLPAYQVSPEATRAIIKAFIDVFPQSILLSGFNSELILMGAKGDEIEIDPVAVAARLAERPEVRADLERVELGTMTELVGTFAADGATLRAATEGTPAVSDDFPITEYAEVTPQDDSEIPADIFDVTTIGAWCPSCFDQGRPIAVVGNLDTYLSILGAIYQTRQLRGWPGKQRSGGVRIPATPRVSETIAQSQYLQHWFKRAGAAATSTMTATSSTAPR